MNLVRALLCLIGLHDWRYAGSGESICRDCGYESKAVRRTTRPLWLRRSTRDGGHLR